MALNDDFIDIIRDFLKLVKGDLQPYVTEEVSILVDGSGKASVFAPSHLQFAYAGRGPGKQPPLDPILQWVSEKGVIFEGSTKEGTAWAIAKSIAKNGTKNWKPGAPDIVKKAIEEHNRDFLKKLADRGGKIFLEELQMAYEEIGSQKIMV